MKYRILLSLVGFLASVAIGADLPNLDTPENVHPSKPVQEYGKDASRFTRNLLQRERGCLAHGDSTFAVLRGETAQFC